MTLVWVINNKLWDKEKLKQRNVHGIFANVWDMEEVEKGAEIHSYSIDDVLFLATLANAT